MPIKLEIGPFRDELLAPISAYDEILSSNVGPVLKELVLHLKLPVLYENAPSAFQSILNRMSVNEDDMVELLKFSDAV